MDYSDNSDAGIDHKESARDFIQSIENFVYRKARELGAARIKMGIPEGLTQQELANWKYRGSQRKSMSNILSSSQLLIGYREIKPRYS